MTGLLAEQIGRPSHEGRGLKLYNTPPNGTGVTSPLA